MDFENAKNINQKVRQKRNQAKNMNERKVAPAFLTALPFTTDSSVVELK
jgi:hypothetical protein